MRALFYIAVIFLLSSCTLTQSQIAVELDRVESLMQTDPSSAYESLNFIDITQCDDSAVMARWALLYSEAMLVNNHATPNDTIVDIALDYYGRHDLVDDFRKASHIKALLADVDNRDRLATALYLQKEKEFFLYKERCRFCYLLFIALLVVVVSFGIILWLRLRLKLMRARNEALMSEASHLYADAGRLRSSCDEMSSKLAGLLQSRFAILDGLCQTYFESQGTVGERKAVLRKVVSIVESLRGDNVLFMQIESAVNDCRNGILRNLRHDYPNITDDEYRLFVYLAGGFSSRSIALFTSQSVEVVYKRKSRLKGRLSSLATPNKEFYLAVF